MEHTETPGQQTLSPPINHPKKSKVVQIS